MKEPKAPKGIGFHSIKTGETNYATREAQIQAYINSSNMGINASRGQDFGWRLAPEWVKKVDAFKKNDVKMEMLASKTDGRQVTDVQILYYMYGQELRTFAQAKQENENPHEEQYLQDISNKPKQEPGETEAQIEARIEAKYKEKAKKEKEAADKKAKKDKKNDDLEDLKESDKKDAPKTS